MNDRAREAAARRAKATPPSGQGLFDRVRAVFGLGAPSIRDDIEDALEDTGSESVFSTQERAMMRNVLGLHELRVVDIMVPRADVIAVGLHMSLGEVLDVFREAGHSRLPVHGDTLDDPRGMVHIRDFVEILVGHHPKGEARPSAAVTLATPLETGEVIRPVLFVPPSMQALDLLRKMQASRTHMALVIDEYGGTDGLVTIEDIVEMIVGDIEDEHDEEEAPLIEAEAGGTYLADGRAALDDVSAAVGVDLTVGDAEEIDTIGGLVTALCGHLPLRGEVVTGHADFDFEVLDADPRRVKRLRIRARDAAPPDDAPDDTTSAGSAEAEAARTQTA
ncbi:HlyC/CorC family transporter [Lichenibacterium minor]|uniref:HlyC/CorC family transporter n=1 Tax=Lichenibacterium minor TaxID=2316528 RepID=A0A4Q2U612_9HYPH|nr:hemolysin family protein [Lichenibacterium minor]RYC30511.1 HlyC/CorC family transporter [Lichenibacterium minor]